MSKISRRDFLKSSAAITTSIAVGSLLTGCNSKEEDSDFTKTIEWNNEYDVIVLGFGAAGATAAITASMEGAKVLLVEKAPKSMAGGNSRVCGQRIATVEPTEKDNAIAYIKAMRGDFTTPSDQVIEAYVDQLIQNESWLKSTLGIEEFKTIGTVDFKDLPGAGSIVNKCSYNTKGFDAKTYHTLKEKVLNIDNIEVWYNAEATDLLQDPITKIVHGALLNIENKLVNVRAKNGVVLATGGFEVNKEMHKDYFCATDLRTSGNAIYNTGDGVKMGSKVNAKMWHMANYVTDIEFEYPNLGIVVFGSVPSFAKMGIVMIDGNGSRFKNDSKKSAHGKIHFADTEIQEPIPKRMYAFFNKEIMESQPRINKQFSLNNEEELKSDWIQQGETIEELASKINVPVEGLKRTIELIDRAIGEKEDIIFGRDVTTLRSLKNGPYYAIPLVASIVNTMGGPKRNEKGEILDLDENPIPHLYGAGELGDIWPKEYQGSCNFGGGMAYGRISGLNATLVKNDVNQNSVLNSKNLFVPTEKEEGIYECNENQYIGQANGMGGTPVVVRVTTDNDTITNIEILSYSETPGVSSHAINEIPNKIIDANTYEVDAISGSTVTSNAIKEAVEAALSSK